MLVAFADLCGLDERTAYRLSAPFGGGLGRQREVCGAVSGMCMVLGFLYGYDDLSDAPAKAEHYRLVQELCGAFKQRFGSIVCRELLGTKTATTTPEPDPRTAMHENSVEIALGSALTFTFDAPTALGTLRLRFDPDFSRESISPNKKMRVFAQKLHTGKDFVPVKVAATLPKGFDVLADGRVIFSTDSNHRSAVKLPLNVTAKELSILFRTTNGTDTVRLYGIDLI